jgi:hypothetical protein
MWSLYGKILALTIGVSNFSVLALAPALGHALKSWDFLAPAFIQFLLVSLVFLWMELVRMHDARVAARTLAQHTGEQLAGFKTAFRTSTSNGANFSRGI